MALTLGKICLSAIRGQLRAMPILLNPARYEHKIPEEILNASKEDMPIDVMENPFQREKPKCILCKYNIIPDYKNARLLSQFQSSYTGRIYGRNVTGLCKKKQAQVELEISKAQAAGYMPYMNKERMFLDDPRIFDPERPIRNHSY